MDKRFRLAVPALLAVLLCAALGGWRTALAAAAAAAAVLATRVRFAAPAALAVLVLITAFVLTGNAPGSGERAPVPASKPGGGRA